MRMSTRTGGTENRLRLLPIAVATALLLILSGCATARNAASSTTHGNTLSSSTPASSTPASTAGGTVLVATLAPEAPNTTGGGTARLVLRPEQQTICAVLHVTGIALPATGAHIHYGAAGATGPIVVPLTAPNAQGVSTGCTHASPTIVNSLIQHPANYYVNVHNATYSEGAMRGQLSTCGPHMNC